MLDVGKGLPCSMKVFDFILNAMFEAFKQGDNMSFIKRIIKHRQGSLAQTVCLSIKEMQKIREYLGQGRHF